MIMHIYSDSLSVVVYGNVCNETKSCLESIRENFSRAEIVLSTWENSVLTGLDFDSVILNREPQSYFFEHQKEKYNNINKIIVSASQGVLGASRAYVLVVRSDMLVVNSNILNFRDNYEKRDPLYCLFSERIFSYEMFSLQYENRANRKYYTPFHVSDWCYLGLKEDMRELFKINKVTEPDFSYYFLFHLHNKDVDIWPNRMWKMSPEQYITYQNTRKKIKSFSFQDRLDWSKTTQEISDRFIVNNFLFKSIKDWGIVIQKKDYKWKNINSYPHTSCGAWLGKNWLKAYKNYCDEAYVLPLSYCWREKFGITQDMVKLRKHCAFLLSPLLNIYRCVLFSLRWLREPLSVVYYSTRIVCKILRGIFPLKK